MAVGKGAVGKWAVGKAPDTGSVASLAVNSTGSIAFFGAGSAVRGKHISAAGDLVLSGAAGVEHVGIQSQTNNSAGGIAFTGAVAAITGKVLTAAGGVSFSGTTSPVKGASIGASGGVVFGGSAGVDYEHFGVEAEDLKWRTAGYGR